MNTRLIFISHASKDDGFVKELREALWPPIEADDLRWYLEQYFNLASWNL